MLFCLDLVLERVDVPLLLFFLGLVGVGTLGGVGRTSYVFFFAIEAGKVDCHVILPLLRFGVASLLDLLYVLPLLVVRPSRGSLIRGVLLFRKRV